ncbi:MAG: DUF935 family protein [Mariprofundus sp.]|nr:DUF935 family protein [Mariprofundus sp.]
MRWFKKENNAQEKTADKEKLAKGKTIQISLQDKHEPFGSLSIETIKEALLEEDFAQMQSLFFHMMRDLKIASAVLTRSQQLIGQDFVLTTDNEDFKAWVLAHVPLDDLISQIASGIYYGVSLTDVRYAVQDLKLVPAFAHISPRYLYADTEASSQGKQLKSTIEHLYIKQNDKKLFLSKLDDNRMVFHKHPIDIGEITDFSLASKLVWYFSLKHIALAHNLNYFDNVATPPLIAKTSGNEDDIIDTLYTLKSACVGVFDKDDVVEYLKVDNKADFLNFIEYIDRQIATLILGNTLSTGEGKNGSRAQSEVHENRQTEILRFDARLIAKTITAYLNRLEKLNEPNAQGITFSFPLKQKKNLLDLSGVVKNLSDSGFLLDDEDIEAQFGFKIIGKKQAANASTSSATENNKVNGSGCACCNTGMSRHSREGGNPSAPYDALDQQAQGLSTQQVENELMDSILSTIAKAETYEQAYQSLLESYPDMPLDKLENALFNSRANSHLLGVAEIESEASDG